MSRNHEVRLILKCREIAERQRQEQRAAARERKRSGRIDVLANVYVRDSSFPKKLFGER
jgi:hypothetical protein